MSEVVVSEVADAQRSTRWVRDQATKVAWARAYDAERFMLEVFNRQKPEILYVEEGFEPGFRIGAQGNETPPRAVRMVAAMGQQGMRQMDHVISRWLELYAEAATLAGAKRIVPARRPRVLHIPVDTVCISYQVAVQSRAVKPGCLEKVLNSPDYALLESLAAKLEKAGIGCRISNDWLMLESDDLLNYAGVPLQRRKYTGRRGWAHIVDTTGTYRRVGLGWLIVPTGAKLKMGSEGALHQPMTEPITLPVNLPVTFAPRAQSHLPKKDRPEQG